MPQTTPVVTDTSSVLSIRRIAPIEPAASPAQPPRGRLAAPCRVGNEAMPHVWAPNAGSARATALQSPQSRTGCRRILPSTLVWAQSAPQPLIGTGRPTVIQHASALPIDVVGLDSDGPQPVISPPRSEALTAYERQTFEHCAVQLRSGWSNFQDDLIAHGVSELDPSWPHASRQIFEMSARQLLLDQPPSELGKQPVFAGFLDKPGCLRSLLPATLRWLEAHVEVLERGDIERMGTSRITSSKHLYLSEMTTLLEGRFEQALEDPTLLKIFNALHVGDTALAELEPLHRASTLQWTAWLQGTPAPNR